MTKAIIFDCYGVLTSDGWTPFKRKYFSHKSKLEQQATDLNKQVNSGLIGYAEFMRQIADLAGVSAQEARAAVENNVADEDLFAYISSRLKPSYKIGMLSNAADNWLNELFTPDQTAVFDAIALSYDIGVVKPDRQAYRAIASKLGVEAEECIFIDDQERFCTAARDFGMQAIWYKEFDQMKTELEALLAKS